VTEIVPVATVILRRLRRLRRGVGSTKSPTNMGGLLVPVERIELPTFGLQNRCSTAELNRRLTEFSTGCRYQPANVLATLALQPVSVAPGGFPVARSALRA
jgi:hypothetical protein